MGRRKKEDDPTAVLLRRQKVREIGEREQIEDESGDYAAYLESVVIKLDERLQEMAKAAEPKEPKEMEPLRVPEKKIGRPLKLDDPEVIQRVLELRRKGASYPSIAADLELDGISVKKDSVRRLCDRYKDVQ